MSQSSKTHSLFFLLLISPALALVLPLQLFGQEGETRRPGQVRDVELSQPEQRLTYRVVQDNTIEKFATIEKLVIALKDGSTDPVPTFNDHEIDYLTAIYLFCSLQNGTCPLVLDALLEADLIHAVQNNVNECPNLTQFWRHWVRGEMERRFEYDLKVGHFNAAEQFKREQRPQYIRCADTITGLREDIGSPQEFFRKRYSVSAKPLENISRTRALLEQAKERIPNVFGRVGVRR